MVSRFTRSVPVTINDVLDGHVALDLQCLDRLYLHGYLAQLQVGGQVIQFLSHRGYPVPSPACLQQFPGDRLPVIGRGHRRQSLQQRGLLGTAGQRGAPGLRGGLVGR